MLALLIVESFLFGAGWLFNFPMQIRINLMWIGVILFMFVMLIVTGLVVWCPQNLVFSEKSHVQLALASYGAKSNPVSVESIETTPLVGPPDLADTRTKQLEASPHQEGQA